MWERSGLLALLLGGWSYHLNIHQHPLILGLCGRECEQGSVNTSVHELAAQGKEVAGKEAKGWQDVKVTEKALWNPQKNQGLGNKKDPG